MADISSLTYATAKAANPKLIGEAFSKLLLIQSHTKDVFGQMEGPEGSDRPFLVKTELSKIQGNRVNFSVTASAGSMPRRGEQTLKGTEEGLPLNSYGVTIDIVRHAVAYNEKVKQFLAAGMSLEEAYATILSDHFGRFKETDMKMCLRNKATAGNTVRPNNVASIDELTSVDVISPAAIEECLGNMTSNGALPFAINKSKAGADVLRQLIFGTRDSLGPLKTNSQYLAAVQAAGIQGDNNTIFKGGFVDWDGSGIYSQNIVDANTHGPIGDPLTPKLRLGEAIAAGTTAPTIKGGGLLGPVENGMYTRWFYGFDYQWIEGQTAAPDAGEYYVVIYNTTGANRGKFGVYKYVGTGNNGQQITCTARLGPSVTGVAVDELAGQEWNASIHTNEHPVGSMVIQVNALCVPVTKILGLGVASGVRAYGKTPMQMIKDVEDYGFINGRGYLSIYGQDVAKDPASEIRNYTIIECAYRVPGISLPVITA